MLTHKDFPFVFSLEQIAAQEDLKQALLTSPVLHPLDYKSLSPVILAVDTSYIAVGFHLCQCDHDNPCKCYYTRFSSITLNDREAHFLQPKLELYGLYRALHSQKLYLIGICNLIIEVDAQYIKGMLANADLELSTSINRWILAILTFHFILVHVPGMFHGPDGLLCKQPQPGDQEEPDDNFNDWVDRVHGLMHMINNRVPWTHKDDITTTAFIANEVNSADIALLGDDSLVTYANVPHTVTAQLADDRLLLMQ